MDAAQLNCLAVLPARYQSSRLPGKPLADINGKSLLQRVWEQVSQARHVSRIVIATDDERIAAAAQAFGAEVLMTAADLPSGTDRVAATMQQLQQQGETFALVANIQGDMPFINPAAIDLVIERLNTAVDCDMATIAAPLTDPQEFSNPAAVKVVVGLQQQALYFSRAPVPHTRDDDAADRGAYKHVGLYVFRPGSLARLTQMPPSPLEQREKLEQLRALENGLKITVAVVSRALITPSIEVDTPADLKKAIGYCKERGI